MTPGARFRKSLVYPIGALFLLLLLVASAVGVFTIRHFIKKDLEAATRQEILKTVRLLESDIESVRDEALLLAQFAARAATTRAGAWNPGEATLQAVIVEAARAKGIELGEVDAGQEGMPDWEVLRRGFAGMPTVDYVIHGEGPGKIHVVAVAPVGSPGGHRRVVTASVSLDREYLRREIRGMASDVSLVAKGEVVVSTSLCEGCLRCLTEVLFARDQWRHVEGGRSIYFSFDCEPEPHAVAVVPFRTFDRRMVALAVFRSRLDEKNALAHATLAVAGAGLAFAAALTALFVILARRVIRPLRELTGLAGRISEGRYGETVPARGEDEVADLAHAFNRMSGSLRQAHEEITAWNRLLEVRVEEKTREIEKIHRRMVEVEKLAAVGQLAAGVAHELNNPLSGIMGYAEVALERHRRRAGREPSPEETEAMVASFSQIETLSQRCRSIILDMLTFARSHAEEPKPVSLNDVVRQTLAFLEKQFEKGKVRVEARLAEGLPDVTGNPLQLQQVFTNIAINAVQAMPSGGTLAVETRAEDGAVLASFRDTGAGIPGEHRERIFEPFFTTKPVGKGTGLGLSVSYGIVKRHGGEIRVESEAGEGSTFTVVLPAGGGS